MKLLLFILLVILLAISVIKLDIAIFKFLLIVSLIGMFLVLIYL